MARSSGRLERLLSEKLGECCAGDVDRRLEADVAVLGTLADATRYRIVRLLAAAENELCVCELTPLVDVSQGAISHALSDLREAGLIDRRKESRWRYYRTTARAEALLAALGGDAGGGGDGSD